MKHAYENGILGLFGRFLGFLVTLPFRLVSAIFSKLYRFLKNEKNEK